MKDLLTKIIVVLSLVFLLQQSVVYAQCAMCKAVVESDKVNPRAGLNKGILYLMSVPYLMAGVGLFVWPEKPENFTFLNIKTYTINGC